jgi:hypothetical protein
MAKVTIVPIFDIHHSEVTQQEGPSDQFANIQRDDDMMRWMGRGSTFELPESAPHGGPHGAGGNADDSGDPIDKMGASSQSFRIAGPANVTEKGSTPGVGKKGRK